MLRAQNGRDTRNYSKDFSLYILFDGTANGSRMTQLRNLIARYEVV